MPIRCIRRWLLLALVVAPIPSGPLAAQADSGFTAWAAARAIPIDSSERAFRSLDSLTQSVRLIGVGESVHGMQQFMELRVALLEHVVRRRRVTALILESGLPEAIAADDYVNGRADSLDFSTALGPDYNASDVVRRAIVWLRTWNLGEGKSHPVHIYGADMSIGDGRSMLPALDRLGAVAGTDARVAALVDSVRPIAAQLAAPWFNGAVRNYGALTANVKAHLDDLTTRLVDAAHAWRGGSPDQRAWADRLARIARQDEVMLRRGPYAPESPRDQAMADNTSWIVERLPIGEQAILWAHDAHVQRSLLRGPALPPAGIPIMGYRLGRTMGPAYFAVGTAYGGPSADSANAPLAGSVDAALGAISTPPYLLPIRNAPSDGALGAWLHADRPMRFQVGHLLVPLADAFDAIVYVDKVSPVVAPR